ncbi:hypothetical protein H7X65_03475 [Candidatus Parcubacteria bacterium]|nr:hypothetical protein [Candidatus Parcubacteria bacterium]
MYIAANLTEDSVKLLREKIPPKYGRVFCHHMTMAFNPSQATFDKYKDLIGTEIELFVMAYCHDDRAQAVLIDTNLSENEYPHITLSCDERTKPVYSEELLQRKTNYGNIYFKLKAIVAVND